MTESNPFLFTDVPVVPPKPSRRWKWAAAFVFIATAFGGYTWCIQPPVIIENAALEEIIENMPDSVAQVPVVVQPQSGNEITITLPGGVPLEMALSPRGVL